MKKLAHMLLVLILYACVHEGTHALVAALAGEYQAFHVRPFGLEVTFNTLVSERHGIQWAYISGFSNAITILIGYMLFAVRRRIASCQRSFLRDIGFWAIFLFMLLDPINLGLGPFIYQGDAIGVAVGLGVSRYVVQGVSLVVLLLNRELIVREVFGIFGVQTRHPLFQRLRLFRRPP
jgi:hypothetical protein